jgi:hypothetical protein
MGDKNASQTASADNSSVSLGTRLGIVRFKVEVSLKQAASAVGDWFGAMAIILNPLVTKHLNL